MGIHRFNAQLNIKLHEKSNEACGARMKQTTFRRSLIRKNEREARAVEEKLYVSGAF